MMIVYYKLTIYIIISMMLMACSDGLSNNTASKNITTISGPLRVNPHNPRYFTDDNGKAIYLTGSHNWANLQDVKKGGHYAFYPDYQSHLDMLKKYNHNFLRMWYFETSVWFIGDEDPHSVSPHPFARTGPGIARDGLPKFDLTKLNQEYFGRLKNRVKAAADHGIYVSIMLFQGIASVNRKEEWEYNPFHKDNNINGINGDKNGDGFGKEVHTLADPEITKIQEAYVRTVIDTVNAFDNILYEIGNELTGGSTAFQYHMIHYIKDREKSMPKQHPVGMTFQWDGRDSGKNGDLFDGPADWVSPAVEPGQEYKTDPPSADGRKVIILDTDHLWGTGGDRVWVWKSFLRGDNPVYMDPLEENNVHKGPRRAMGHTLAYARKMDLRDMSPREDLSSTRYCLANPGTEYLVYQPEARFLDTFLKPSFAVDLAPGRYGYEWFNPRAGSAIPGKVFTSEGGHKSFRQPFGGDAVLYIYKQ
jgi:hypothetical protein